MIFLLAGLSRPAPSSSSSELLLQPSTCSTSEKPLHAGSQHIALSFSPLTTMNSKRHRVKQEFGPWGPGLLKLIVPLVGLYQLSSTTCRISWNLEHWYSVVQILPILWRETFCYDIQILAISACTTTLYSGRTVHVRPSSRKVMFTKILQSEFLICCLNLSF